jgi:hypothetical protein
MPVRNASSVEEKKEKITIFSIALNREQRKELKQILKDFEVIYKEAIAPLRINENIQLIVEFYDIPIIFQYQNVLKVKDVDKFLKSEYDNLYFAGMERTSKGVNLTQIEQILLDTWEQIDIYAEMVEDSYKNIPSVDAEIKNRMRRQFENQVRLENFIISCIDNKTEGAKFLNKIKDLSGRELDEFFEWALKGETVKVW